MIVGIDFDGTISHYDGFKGKGNFGDPIPGSRIFINKLISAGHIIVIYTTRLEVDQIRKYLLKHDINFHHINFSPDNIERDLHPAKQCCSIYIDDRAINFGGDWEDTFEKILNFKPWWKND